jgi:hypothetical protein
MEYGQKSLQNITSAQAVLNHFLQQHGRRQQQQLVTTMLPGHMHEGVGPHLSNVVSAAPHAGQMLQIRMPDAEATFLAGSLV